MKWLVLIFSLIISQSGIANIKVDPELRAYLKNEINAADSFEDRFAAEVWMVDMSARLSRYIKDKEFRVRFLRMVHKEATAHDLPPEMVLALIQIESAFKPYAISVVGAQGYMQIMPFWRNEIGRPDDNLMDAKTNLRYGCTILAYYLKKEKGDWIRGLARYNGSLGKTWYPEKVLNAWQKRWFVKNI